jgi:hypothetical protein
MIPGGRAGPGAAPPLSRPCQVRARRGRCRRPVGRSRALLGAGVHEVPGTGAWIKVPLGKLDTERMVPVDDQALDLLDRIAAVVAAEVPEGD